MLRWYITIALTLVLLTSSTANSAFCDNLLKRGLVSHFIALTETFAAKSYETNIFDIRDIVTRLGQLLKRPNNLITFYSDPLLNNIRMREKYVKNYGRPRLAQLREDLVGRRQFAAVSLKGQSEILAFLLEYVDGRGVSAYPFATMLIQNIIAIGTMTGVAFEFYTSLELETPLEIFLYPYTYAFSFVAMFLAEATERLHISRAQRVEEARALAAILHSLNETTEFDSSDYFYFYRDFPQARVDVIFSYEGELPIMDIIVR